jgi:hypothetical protein
MTTPRPLTRLGWALVWLLTNLFFPALLVCQCVLPLWIVNQSVAVNMIQPYVAMVSEYRFLLFADVLELKGPRRQFIVGIVLLVIHKGVVTYWVAALVYCLYMAHWVARRRDRVYLPPVDRYLVQVDGPGSTVRRFCSVCEIFQDERAYHCGIVGRCLPMFDHTCPWWQGPVFRDNTKAYLNFLLFLSLHTAFCTAFGIYGIAKKKYQNAMAGTLVVSFAGFLLASGLFRHFVLELVLRNRTGQESDQREIFFFVSAENRFEGELVWEASRDVDGNPWHLGWRENMRLVLGPWWSWLAFWKSTPIMQLDEYPTRLQLLPTAVVLTPLRSRRRREAASTGIEEIELGNLSEIRRRRSSF